MEQPNIITKAERLARKGGCSTCGKKIKMETRPDQNVDKLPSRWEMLKNLVQAGKDAIASGLEVRNAEDTEKALKICDECPSLVIDDGNARCAVCGCFLGGNGRLGKTSLSGWHCPLGKW